MSCASSESGSVAQHVAKAALRRWREVTLVILTAAAEQGSGGAVLSRLSSHLLLFMPLRTSARAASATSPLASGQRRSGSRFFRRLVVGPRSRRRFSSSLSEPRRAVVPVPSARQPASSARRRCARSAMPARCATARGICAPFLSCWPGGFVGLERALWVRCDRTSNAVDPHS